MPHEAPQLVAPFLRPGVVAQTRYPDTVATSTTSDRILARATPSLLADYATLIKLRVSTMVIITAAAGYYLGSLRSGISPSHPGYPPHPPTGTLPLLPPPGFVAIFPPLKRVTNINTFIGAFPGALPP